MTSRVYFKNLNYYTTEGELTEFLQDYYPVNVLIPSYTIRFSRSDKHKPLGIAYAEFESQETADKVVSEINGKPFKGRQLSVKYHVPFSPKPRKVSSNSQNNLFRDSSALAKTGTPEVSTQEEDPQIQNQETSEELPNDEKSQEPEQEQNVGLEASQLNVLDDIKEEPAVSDEFIFLNNISYKVTDEDLREYFKDYHPTDIYIYKRAPRGKRDSISFKRRRYVSALVRLDTESELPDVFEALKSKKLKGKRVLLRAAYLDKVEEVVKAAKEKELSESSAEPQAEGYNEPETVEHPNEEVAEEKQEEVVSQAEILNSEDSASRKAVYDSEEQEIKELSVVRGARLNHQESELAPDTETIEAPEDNEFDAPTEDFGYQGAQEDATSQETRPIDGTIVDSYRENNNQ